MRFQVGDLVRRKPRRDVWPYGDRVLRVTGVGEGDLLYLADSTSAWSAANFTLVAKAVDHGALAMALELADLVYGDGLYGMPVPIYSQLDVADWLRAEVLRELNVMAEEDA